ncbi:MAG: hypothetical protein K1X89_09690 [Myxococcaceae bacterium]|nr:hypothetical protein [Myxococcaceae bacterium]
MAIDLQKTVAFLQTRTGNVVAVAGCLSLFGLAALVGRAFPSAELTLVNGFDAALEVRAGAKHVTVPPHGLARLKLDTHAAELDVIDGHGTVLEHFSHEAFDGDVYNLVGAAPLTREKVRWDKVKGEKGKLSSTVVESTLKCGVRYLRGAGINDLFRDAPDAIPIRSTEDSVVRERLDFDRQAPATACQEPLQPIAATSPDAARTLAAIASLAKP